MRVQSIGYIDRKKDWIDRSFSSFNFSIISEGTGRYLWKGRWIDVEAPMVITQWPGVPALYGPAGNEKWWRELYIMYDASFMPELRRCCFADEQRPVWRVQSGAEFTDMLATFIDRCHWMREAPDVDALDRACEALIYTSLKTSIRDPRTDEEAVVRKVKDLLKLHCCEHVDIDRIARENGLSGSTFRRYWARYNDSTPWQYVIALRIRAACRMLVETDQRVREIAYRTGFRDPLYFSRKFRELCGLSPRQYRARHRRI